MNTQEMAGEEKLKEVLEEEEIPGHGIKGTIEEVINQIENPKGEYIIIIDENEEIEDEENELNNLSLEEHYKYYENQGMNKKEIIKQIAKDRNVSKNDIYMKFI